VAAFPPHRARAHPPAPLGSVLRPVLLLGWLLLPLGCAGTGHPPTDAEPGARVPPPGWALTGNSPDLPGSVCAVGIAGPTFFRFDAVETACDAARSGLARTLRVRIHTTSLDIQTGESGSRDSQSVMQVASYVNDLVLEGSRIVEVWYDESGAGFARKPNYTYALACIDEASVSGGPEKR